jgi:hypothetical protein
VTEANVILEPTDRILLCEFKKFYVKVTGQFNRCGKR